MFRILVPVDFSESTTNACQYALALASAAPDAHLLLMHCYQDYLADADPDYSYAEDLSPSEEVTERVLHRNETEAQQQLDELYQYLQATARNIGLQVYLNRTFIHGMPEDKIPEQVARFHPNLLIMGTRVESSLARSFFGTVPTKIVEEVRVPVLTVPEHAQAHQLNKVLCATDFDKADTQVITTLQQLLQPFRPTVYCVHVSEHNGRKDSERLQKLQQQLQHSTASNIQFMLLEGDDVAQALQDFARKEGINLLALTAHENGSLSSIFHTSLAKKLVLHAELPLLVFHSPRKD